MGSVFIEGSKHALGTAAVEKHFAGGNVGQSPGVDPLLKAPPYGSSAWNPPARPTEQGMVNDKITAPPGPSVFNASSPPLPRETGVNYKPHANAGHKVTDDPFSPWADGFPGR